LGPSPGKILQQDSARVATRAICYQSLPAAAYNARWTHRLASLSNDRQGHGSTPGQAPSLGSAVDIRSLKPIHVQTLLGTPKHHPATLTSNSQKGFELEGEAASGWSAFEELRDPLDDEIRSVETKTKCEKPGRVGQLTCAKIRGQDRPGLQATGSNLGWTFARISRCWKRSRVRTFGKGRISAPSMRSHALAMAVSRLG